MLQLETTTSNRTEAPLPSSTAFPSTAVSPAVNPQIPLKVDKAREEDAISEKTAYGDEAGPEKVQNGVSKEEASRAAGFGLESPPYTIWSRQAQWAIVSLLMTASLFSPLSANSYIPAIPLVADELGVSTQAVNLSVTLFLVFQGVTPTFWGAICDVRGRRPVYILTFTVYVAACIGLSQTTSYGVLLALRCIQAAGSASVVALGNGSVGDLAPRETRGTYVGMLSMGAMLGPCIGPVAGGLLADRWGWQSIFTFLAVFGGLVLLLMIFFLPETLRALVGNGSIPAEGINRSLFSIIMNRRRRHQRDVPVSTIALPPRKRWSDIDWLASLKMFREKDVLLVLTYNSLFYALFYCVITSTSTSFKATYHLSETKLGLCYLATGGGMILASAVNGPRLTRSYRAIAAEEKRKAEEEGVVADPADFPIDRARLEHLPYALVLMLGSVIVYGWTVERAVHLAVPLVAQLFIGFASMTTFSSCTCLLIDLFPKSSASATASNNLYRCLTGAAGTALIDPILAALGPGWSFTMLSLILFLFSPLLLLQRRYGSSIRREREAREAAREAAREQRTEGKA
ncbi:major facilitator superfamily domain-containing protein [Leucosporidium creatinivorum]|uniref:Major facilitator superfamily domain-containing protein n=1 Tax=Leucosporidium creatinivorum TaxID=106004 RepID=A0A1Y2FWJ6_9BASI|nr:major facilitator superfamily domain-containing protein [Leucosporidium creatinivorum]